MLSCPAMRAVLKVLAALALVAVASLGLAIALGGPRPPPPMESIGAPFRKVDFSGVPPASRFVARDGQPLAYRLYAPEGAISGSVVLVHGSSARSQSLHPLAAALARAGFETYAIDVRGHGESGPRGRVTYVGQLEDDLEDLVASVAPPRPRLLVGFSAGGGFALRFAGGPRQELFDAYVLLSPFLHQGAPTYRPGAGGWVSIGVPRLVALAILNRAGLTFLNDLPVTAFALDAKERRFLTAGYSYALASSFRPHEDYRADVRAARRPMEIVAGREDEVFAADRFEPAFEQAGRHVPVTLVPGVGHVGLTIEPAGVDAVVAAVRRGAQPRRRGRLAPAGPPGRGARIPAWRG